jgi:hypothetical protein
MMLRSIDSFSPRRFISRLAASAVSPAGEVLLGIMQAVHGVARSAIASG